MNVNNFRQTLLFTKSIQYYTYYLSGYVALAHAQISMQIVTFLILHMGKMCIIIAR